MRIRNTIFIMLSAIIAFSSCYKEGKLVPTPMQNELLFEFPQDNKEHDRKIQDVQENYGTYIIYKDIDQNIINRSWINLFPDMPLVASPVSESNIMHYVTYLEENFFRHFSSEKFQKYFPKYFFILNEMHREEKGVAKAHQYTKTDGIDFWALSFQETEDGGLKTYNSKKIRITLCYALIKKMFDEGQIEVPASFSQGIDYKNPIYNYAYPDGTIPEPVHEFHYQLRGFVKYVQPDFEYESPATNINVVSMAGEDFLMFVRKILFSTPESFIAENSRWELVMKRYQIVLDLFEEMGVDLNAIATE